MTYGLRYASDSEVCSWGPPPLFIEGDANISYTTVEECGWMVFVFNENRINITNSTLLYVSENGFIAQAMSLRSIALGEGGSFIFSDNEVVSKDFFAMFDQGSDVASGHDIVMERNNVIANTCLFGTILDDLTFSQNTVQAFNENAYSAIHLVTLLAIC